MTAEAKTLMPSADELTAKVLDAQENDLEWRVAQGQEFNVGIFEVAERQFAWLLSWSGALATGRDFHLQVFHVRPRTHKLVVDRHFKEK